MAWRSSIIVLVPEAEPLVAPLRHAHDPTAFAGIGAHVTLLFPFMPAPQIDDAVVARVAAQLGRGPLELRFDRVARFPGLSYLALDEPAHVVARIRALAAAWPDYPPYEGRFPDVVPHLTVAFGDDAVHAVVRAELEPRLPLVTTVEHASLFVEDGADIWHERARFAV